MTEETKSKEEARGFEPTPATVEKSKRLKQKQKKDQPVQDESQDQKGLVEFAGTAIRAQRGGTFETFLSQSLASSLVVTDPLKHIKIVCEAALMIPEKERENLAIDYDKIEVFNQITNALLNPVVESDEWHIEIVSTCWPFSPTEENFNKFILPWFTCRVDYWPIHMKACCKWHRRQCFPYDIVIDEVIREPFWRWFFEASHCLSKAGCNALKNAFAAWATPQVQLYLTELTKIVSPSLYSQVLGLYTNHKRKGYAEKVKEAAEVSTDEDSLGAGF